MWKKAGKNSGNKTDFGVASIISILITVAAILGLTFGKYSCQIGDFSEVRGLKMKITMLEERRENLTSIIRKEMQKYPEIEKEIISNLGPAPSFLFNYPQLKSNLTITKTVDDIVKIQDQVYEMRGRLIESLQCIYLREISPWTIYVKSYEKFFGERNPILKETSVH
ncbi:MAG: hypothetical protein AAB781_02005 [Patescibacteria group bacterium]